jgi:hypothetical protein
MNCHEFRYGIADVYYDITIDAQYSGVYGDWSVAGEIVPVSVDPNTKFLTPNHREMECNHTPKVPDENYYWLPPIFRVGYLCDRFTLYNIPKMYNSPTNPVTFTQGSQTLQADIADGNFGTPYPWAESDPFIARARSTWEANHFVASNTSNLVRGSFGVFVDGHPLFGFQFSLKFKQGETGAVYLVAYLGSLITPVEVGTATMTTLSIT